ncbi:class I SAM-dependent methyltransferase [Cryobacterium adonitolivorans]|uniref:Class I SAM-dependent methyltransferase n=1 Tax=Cryobacterium adonitolivorans TaxID=1259189 RepID=A0A4R8VYH2_9MICO|nr:class I SAM-dependent methyltransferase [Cryobacterium adonitolivorans]TFB97832.1 class I SAM-dependent methyltransferase [Cryobacterium adonitolivorans]
MSDNFDQTYWDERYGAGNDVWSGAPNPVLVSETLALPAGSALDIGCGEGADAIWLASRGWTVTAADFSAVALERAAARSRNAGVDPAESAAIANRILWEHHDFTAWAPPEGTFDLVSAQFMHLPSVQRTTLFRRLASAVAAGGTLLIVGHDVSDSHHQGHTPPADMFFTAAEVAASLDSALWHVDVAESRPRATKDPGGTVITLTDAVVSARRR